MRTRYRRGGLGYTLCPTLSLSLIRRLAGGALGREGGAGGGRCTSASAVLVMITR